MTLEERNARILALRGKMPRGEIARMFGVTYQVVSNVFWRADHPRPPSNKEIHLLGMAAYNAGLTVSKIVELASKSEAA